MTHCNADWLLHVDADEFLHPIGDFAQELGCLPKSFGGLWLENYERAFRAGTDNTSIFDGVFRSFPKTEPHGASLEPFFGKNTPFSRFGFTTHNLGKSFARNDPRFAQGLRKVRLATDDSPQPMANMYCSTTARILHFDGLTTLHWVRKLLRMIAEQSADDAAPAQKPRTTRELQLAMLKNRAGDSAYLIDVHDAHKTISAEDHHSLAALGLLHAVAFNPAEAIRRQFPGTDADLSQEFFDRHLISENKHLKTLFAKIHGGQA